MSMWVDEAESSINALSILQYGVPVGSYLGMPVYENTHLMPWTDSPEYRYKDVSYSVNGVAVYHGWLPLYTIAAALWAADIQPDELHARAITPHSPQQRRWRTIVPRIPAVLFGLAGIVIFYFAAKVLCGTEAGWAAAIISSLSPMHIYVSQQARYFSATVTLSALCAYAIWQIVHRRRWRDCALGAIAFGLLFHTHILTFVIASLVFAGVLLISAICKHPLPWARMCIAAAGTAMLIVPWVIAVDFVHAAATIPSAWRLMILPDDLLLYRVLMRPEGFATVTLLTIIAVLLVRYGTAGAIRKRIEPFSTRSRSFLFLLAWLLTAYFGFVFLIPAASYALARMAVFVLAPATLLAAGVCAALARSIHPRTSFVTASALALASVVVSYSVWPPANDTAIALQHTNIEQAVSYIASVSARPMTRVYANPNDHLLLTYYSGLPVQSIAAVKEEFLNGYEGDIVLLLKHESFYRPGDPIDPVRLRRAAAEHGVALTERDSRILSFDLTTLSQRAEEQRRCAAVMPPVQPPPAFATPAYNAWRRMREERQREYASRWVRHPLFRGYDIRSVTDWWTVFFFRFANAEKELRMPNYAARLRSAVATPLPDSSWMAYYSPGTLASSVSYH
jgi:hypothetical protein